MARFSFGGTVADFVITSTSGGLLRLSSASLTFWDSETGGTRYTDLMLNGAPVTSVAVGSDGQIPTFEGPDSVTDMWADAGGSRARIVSAPPYAELDAFTTQAAGSASSAAASETAAAASAVEAAQVSGLTGEDAAVALLIDTPGSAVTTALSETIESEVGLTPAQTADARNFALNPTGTEFGPSHDMDVSLGGAANNLNRFGNGALGFMDGYDNHRWRGSIAAVVKGFHCVVRTSDGHPTITGGAFNAVFGGYGTVDGGNLNGVYGLRGSVQGGRWSSAGANAATTLAAPTTVGATSITVTSAEGMAVGQDVYIDHGSRTDSAVIASIAGTTIGLTGPYQHITTTDTTGEPTGTGIAVVHAAGTRVFASDATKADATATGDDCHALGVGSRAGGKQSKAWADQSHADGWGCITRGARSRAWGFGCETDVVATDSVAMGSGARTTMPGQVARANGARVANGDSQQSTRTVRTNTTDGTIKTFQILLPVSGQVLAYRATVVANDVTTTPGTVGAAWEVKGLLRVSGTTVSQIGAATITSLGADAAASTWTVAVLAGTGSFNLRITGEAAKTIAWVASVDWTEAG